MKKIEITAATSLDVGEVHRLIYELAEYEKSASSFTLSLSKLSDDFDEGQWHALLARENNTVIGMAFYYWTYSTWKGKMLWLEDLVVSESHRRLGVGQMLFDALINVGKNQGASLLKWQVLDWNKPALNFYEKNKAIIEKEWWNGKLYLE